MPMAVSFTCTACGKPIIAAWTNRPAWAQVAGFSNVGWVAEGTRIPCGDIWPRLATMPVARREYALHVQVPVTIYPRRPFWVLFQPALSAVNGWEEHPTEISASGLVQVVLTEVCVHGETGGWIKARVLQAIPVRDIADRFAEDGSGATAPLLSQLGVRGYCEVRTEDLSYISAQMEGDVGAWVLCQRWGQSARVLMYGEWGFHADYVFAGNRPLQAAEWQGLSREAT